MDRTRANQLLENIVEELNIPKATLEKAIKSYDALAEYINNNTAFSVDIFPQGSIRLGTAIKPINDTDDYDIDLVCYVRHDVQDPWLLKNAIGDVLKNSDRYSKMLQPEGRRCWTLQYAEDAHFHMDVLPAKPGDNHDDEPLKITDKTLNGYSFQSSNPKGYAKWFDQRQKEKKGLQTFSVEKINASSNKTTLQKCIQLLKRHRDIMYAEKGKAEQDNKPISIIITTIAAELYTGDETLLSMIQKFSDSWIECFTKDSCGNLFLKNPVDSSENFADKWVEHPERRTAFIEWTSKLKEDLSESSIMSFSDKVEASEHLQKVFGKHLVREAYKMRIEKNKDLYIDVSGTSVGITTKKTDTPIKKHTFYGN